MASNSAVATTLGLALFKSKIAAHNERSDGSNLIRLNIPAQLRHDLLIWQGEEAGGNRINALILVGEGRSAQDRLTVEVVDGVVGALRIQGDLAGRQLVDDNASASVSVRDAEFRDHVVSHFAGGNEEKLVGTRVDMQRGVSAGYFGVVSLGRDLESAVDYLPGIFAKANPTPAPTRAGKVLRLAKGLALKS